MNKQEKHTAEAMPLGKQVNTVQPTPRKTMNVNSAKRTTRKHFFLTKRTKPANLVVFVRMVHLPWAFLRRSTALACSASSKFCKKKWQGHSRVHGKSKLPIAQQEFPHLSVHRQNLIPTPEKTHSTQEKRRKDTYSYHRSGNFCRLLRWKNLMRKILHWWTIGVRMYAYMCEYHIKVISYTGFHLKRIHTASSSP